MCEIRVPAPSHPFADVEVEGEGEGEIDFKREFPVAIARRRRMGTPGARSGTHQPLRKLNWTK